MGRGAAETLLYGEAPAPKRAILLLDGNEIMVPDAFRARGYRLRQLARAAPRFVDLVDWTLDFLRESSGDGVRTVPAPDLYRWRAELRAELSSGAQLPHGRPLLAFLNQLLEARR